MKVAIVVSNLNINGGTQRQVAELSRYLKSKGNDVTIYTDFYNSTCYPEILDGIPIRALYDQTKIVKNAPKNKAVLYIWRIFNAKKISEMIDKDTEIVNCHDINIELVGYLFCKKYGVPFVWQINDLHGYFKVREVSRVKKILFYLLNLPFIFITKLISGATSAITVNVSKNKDLIKKNLHKDSLVFYCGVDVSKFIYRGVKKVSTPLEILTIGIMYPYRKHEVLIRAVKILKDKGIMVNLTILGSSRNYPFYAKELRELVTELNLSESVNFVEEISEQGLLDLYKKSDIFSFVNHMQSWGNVVFEAMAVGVPVVVSSTVGAVEVIKNNSEAIIVSPNNPQETANAIERLYRDEALYNKIVANAKRLVDNMSWEKMYCEKMLDLFLKIKSK